MLVCPRDASRRRCLRLCFSCPRAPRHLHSFPTRRSSDLTQQLAPWLDALEEAGARLAGVYSAPLLAPALAAALDRKSTRLNSSHTVISYAVFCLKKKKVTGKQEKQHTDCIPVGSHLDPVE